jgi:hypothetical protein
MGDAAGRDAYHAGVTTSIPVAGSLVDIDPGADPLVVEAQPDSEATRCFKNIARYVYRLVQDIRWAGGEHTVTVEVVGDGDMAPTIAMNVGALVAPLLDVAVESSALARLGFDVDADDGTASELSPRDRLWLVEPTMARSHPADRRFDLTIATTPAASHAGPVDLTLVTVEHGRAAVTLPADRRYDEVAAVIVGAPGSDHPESIAVTN